VAEPWALQPVEAEHAAAAVVPHAEVAAAAVPRAEVAAAEAALRGEEEAARHGEVAEAEEVPRAEVAGAGAEERQAAREPQEGARPSAAAPSCPSRLRLAPGP